MQLTWQLSTPIEIVECFEFIGWLVRRTAADHEIKCICGYVEAYAPKQGGLLLFVVVFGTTELCFTSSMRGACMTSGAVAVWGCSAECGALPSRAQVPTQQAWRVRRLRVLLDVQGPLIQRCPTHSARSASRSLSLRACYVVMCMAHSIPWASSRGGAGSVHVPFVFQCL